MPYTPPKKTFLYFALFILLSFAFAWFVVVVPIKQFNHYYSQAPSLVENFINEFFPEDLIIDIRDGEVLINQETPYCLVFDKRSSAGIVFDENANITAPLSNSLAVYSDLCNPWALVGRNFVIYSDSEEHWELQDGNFVNVESYADSLKSGSYKVQEIPSEANFQINRDQIEAITFGVLPQLLNWSRIIYYVLPFMIFPLILISFVMVNFWYGLLAKIIIKFSKINEKITYKEARKKTFFVLLLWTAFCWIVLRFLLNELLNVDIKTSFWIDTIIIVTATVLLEKFSSGGEGEKKEDGGQDDNDQSNDGQNSEEITEGVADQIPQPPLSLNRDASLLPPTPAEPPPTLESVPEYNTEKNSSELSEQIPN